MDTVEINNIVEELNYKDLCNSIVNLTDTAVILYNVKDLYMRVKDALNHIWENVLNICNWFDSNKGDITFFDEENCMVINGGEINRTIYIPFTKSILAREDYNIDYISENIDYFYGANAFDNFCKSIYIINKLDNK